MSYVIYIYLYDIIKVLFSITFSIFWCILEKNFFDNTGEFLC